MLKKLLTPLLINTSRKYLNDFAKEAAESVPEGSLVLDAGAGPCPYKHYFTHVTYESADFCQLKTQYGSITYVCDLANIPVDDERYDLIFCSQVLEHIPEPKSVLKEFNRVLKPGGQLWLSAPLFYEEHQKPYDFYRYTQYGFTYLLESSGFTVKKIEWLEGYYGTVSYQLKMASAVLPKSPEHYGGGLIGIVVAAMMILFLKPLFASLSLLFTQLDLGHKYISSGLCKNYAIIAVK